MTVDSRVLLVMIQIKLNASYVTVSSKCLTSDFIRISQRRVGPNCRAEKRRRGATHWLNGAMFYTLIGSLLQCSCLFISRPVNNLPASVSVILHLSLTPPPLLILSQCFCSLLVLSMCSYKSLSTQSSSPHPDLIPSVTSPFPGYQPDILFFSSPPVIASLFQSFSSPATTLNNPHPPPHFVFS